MCRHEFIKQGPTQEYFVSQMLTKIANNFLIIYFLINNLMFVFFYSQKYTSLWNKNSLPAEVFK